MARKLGRAKRREDVIYALDNGWEYVGVSGGHLKFRHPDTGIPLMITSSPSEYRGLKNKISWIKKLTPNGERSCGTS
jgi:predicted RNA binding protein YcfA (HicA-like mRNA interferase family)